MKSDNKKGQIKHIALAVLAIILGIVAICTSETARNPIRSVLYGIVLIGAGIVIIASIILETIKSGKWVISSWTGISP